MSSSAIIFSAAVLAVAAAFQAPFGESQEAGRAAQTSFQQEWRPDVKATVASDTSAVRSVSTQRWIF